MREGVDVGRENLDVLRSEVVALAERVNARLQHLEEGRFGARGRISPRSARGSPVGRRQFLVGLKRNQSSQGLRKANRLRLRRLVRIQAVVLNDQPGREL